MYYNGLSYKFQSAYIHICTYVHKCIFVHNTYMIYDTCTCILSHLHVLCLLDDTSASAVGGGVGTTALLLVASHEEGLIVVLGFFCITLRQSVTRSHTHNEHTLQ